MLRPQPPPPQQQAASSTLQQQPHQSNRLSSSSHLMGKAAIAPAAADNSLSTTPTTATGDAFESGEAHNADANERQNQHQQQYLDGDEDGGGIAAASFSSEMLYPRPKRKAPATVVNGRYYGPPSLKTSTTTAAAAVIARDSISHARDGKRAANEVVFPNALLLANASTTNNANTNTSVTTAADSSPFSPPPSSSSSYSMRYASMLSQSRGKVGASTVEAHRFIQTPFDNPATTSTRRRAVKAKDGDSADAAAGDDEEGSEDDEGGDSPSSSRKTSRQSQRLAFLQSPNAYAQIVGSRQSTAEPTNRVSDDRAVVTSRSYTAFVESQRVKRKQQRNELLFRSSHHSHESEGKKEGSISSPQHERLSLLPSIVNGITASSQQQHQRSPPRERLPRIYVRSIENVVADEETRPTNANTNTTSTTPSLPLLFLSNAGPQQPLLRSKPTHQEEEQSSDLWNAAAAVINTEGAGSALIVAAANSADDVDVDEHRRTLPLKIYDNTSSTSHDAAHIGGEEEEDQIQTTPKTRFAAVVKPTHNTQEETVSMADDGGDDDEQLPSARPTALQHMVAVSSNTARASASALPPPPSYSALPSSYSNARVMQKIRPVAKEDARRRDEGDGRHQMSGGDFDGGVADHHQGNSVVAFTPTPPPRAAIDRHYCESVPPIWRDNAAVEASHEDGDAAVGEFAGELTANTTPSTLVSLVGPSRRIDISGPITAEVFAELMGIGDGGGEEEEANDNNTRTHNTQTRSSSSSSSSSSHPLPPRPFLLLQIEEHWRRQSFFDAEAIDFNDIVRHEMARRIAFNKGRGIEPLRRFLMTHVVLPFRAKKILKEKRFQRVWDLEGQSRRDIMAEEKALWSSTIVSPLIPEEEALFRKLFYRTALLTFYAMARVQIGGMLAIAYDELYFFPQGECEVRWQMLFPSYNKKESRKNKRRRRRSTASKSAEELVRDEILKLTNGLSSAPLSIANVSDKAKTYSDDDDEYEDDDEEYEEEDEDEDGAASDATAEGAAEGDAQGANGVGGGYYVFSEEESKWYWYDENADAHYEIEGEPPAEAMEAAAAEEGGEGSDTASNSRNRRRSTVVILNSSHSISASLKRPSIAMLGARRGEGGANEPDLDLEGGREGGGRGHGGDGVGEDGGSDTASTLSDFASTRAFGRHDHRHHNHHQPGTTSMVTFADDNKSSGAITSNSSNTALVVLAPLDGFDPLPQPPISSLPPLLPPSLRPEDPTDPLVIALKRQEEARRLPLILQQKREEEAAASQRFHLVPTAIADTCYAMWCLQAHEANGRRAVEERWLRSWKAGQAWSELTTYCVWGERRIRAATVAAEEAFGRRLFWIKYRRATAVKQLLEMGYEEHHRRTVIEEQEAVRRCVMVAVGPTSATSHTTTPASSPLTKVTFTKADDDDGEGEGDDENNDKKHTTTNSDYSAIAAADAVLSLPPNFSYDYEREVLADFMEEATCKQHHQEGQQQQTALSLSQQPLDDIYDDDDDTEATTDDADGGKEAPRRSVTVAPAARRASKGRGAREEDEEKAYYSSPLASLSTSSLPSLFPSALSQAKERRRASSFASGTSPTKPNASTAATPTAPMPPPSGYGFYGAQHVYNANDPFAHRQLLLAAAAAVVAKDGGDGEGNHALSGGDAETKKKMSSPMRNAAMAPTMPSPFNNMRSTSFPMSSSPSAVSPSAAAKAVEKQQPYFAALFARGEARARRLERERLEAEAKEALRRQTSTRIRSHAQKCVASALDNALRSRTSVADDNGHVEKTSPLFPPQNEGDRPTPIPQPKSPPPEPEAIPLVVLPPLPPPLPRPPSLPSVGDDEAHHHHHDHDDTLHAFGGGGGGGENAPSNIPPTLAKAKDVDVEPTRMKQDDEEEAEDDAATANAPHPIIGGEVGAAEKGEEEDGDATVAEIIIRPSTAVPHRSPAAHDAEEEQQQSQEAILMGAEEEGEGAAIAAERTETKVTNEEKTVEGKEKDINERTSSPPPSPPTSQPFAADTQTPPLPPAPVASSSTPSSPTAVAAADTTFPSSHRTSDIFPSSTYSFSLNSAATPSSSAQFGLGGGSRSEATPVVVVVPSTVGAAAPLSSSRASEAPSPFGTARGTPSPTTTVSAAGVPLAIPRAYADILSGGAGHHHGSGDRSLVVVGGSDGSTSSPAAAETVVASRGGSGGGGEEEEGLARGTSGVGGSGVSPPLSSSHQYDSLSLSFGLGGTSASFSMGALLGESPASPPLGGIVIIRSQTNSSPQQHMNNHSNVVSGGGHPLIDENPFADYSDDLPHHAPIQTTSATPLVSTTATPAAMMDTAAVIPVTAAASSFSSDAPELSFPSTGMSESLGLGLDSMSASNSPSANANSGISGAGGGGRDAPFVATAVFREPFPRPPPVRTTTAANLSPNTRRIMSDADDNTATNTFASEGGGGGARQNVNQQPPRSFNPRHHGTDTSDVTLDADDDGTSVNTSAGNGGHRGAARSDGGGTVVANPVTYSPFLESLSLSLEL